MRTEYLSVSAGVVALTCAAPAVLATGAILVQLWPVIPLAVALGSWGSIGDKPNKPERTFSPTSKTYA